LPLLKFQPSYVTSW